MHQKIEEIQLRLLEKAKNYLQINEKIKSMYYVANSENYLSSWAVDTLGYLRLYCLHLNKLTCKKLFSSYVRNFIYLGYQQELCFDNHYSPFKYKNVIISWCTKKDFLEDGSFQCKYFNYNSKKISEVLWVLVSLDNFIPTSKDNNIIIFIKKQIKQFSINVFVKNLFFCLWNRIPCTIESIFAKKFADECIEKISINNIDKLLLPYEAQPWQHMLFLILKQKNKNISVIGDLHSCLPPFPSDFIKRYGSPNKLLVHGLGQKDIMVNMLGWDKKEIEIAPSRRFTKNHYIHLVNKILLPYRFDKEEFILKTLEAFFQYYSNTLPLLEVRNHPIQTNSKKHKNLIHNIIMLQDKYFHGTSNTINGKVAVVIGASSVVIECLTQGIKVFQIVEHPIFDTYSSKIWTNLQAKYIDQNILEYDVCKGINYLEFGNNDLQEVFAND